MERRRRLLLLALTIAVALASGLALSACEVSVTSTHQLALKDDGTTINVHTGDLIQIDLPLQSGYSDWQLEPSPSTVLDPVFSGKVESAGTSGTVEGDRFVYRAVKGGHVKLIGSQTPNCGDTSCNDTSRSFTVAVIIS